MFDKILSLLCLPIPPHSHATSEDEWSGRRGSNPRPQPWQGCALPLSYSRMCSKYMAPDVGFEPTTNRLTADYSTAELIRNICSLKRSRNYIRFFLPCQGVFQKTPKKITRLLSYLVDRLLCTLLQDPLDMRYR